MKMTKFDYTKNDIIMLNQLAAIETALMRLTLKQKNFIYRIARLEYRIYKSLTKLNEVNVLIEEEKQNIKSWDTAIKATRKGNVTEKLTIWKVKAEYKLFKLNLRKNKIDIVKLILNQSKLEQLKQALIALEADIEKIKVQKQGFAIVEINKNELYNESIFESWGKLKQIKEDNPVNQSIKAFLKENFKMAS